MAGMMAPKGGNVRTMAMETFHFGEESLESRVTGRVLVSLLHLPLCRSFPYAIDLEMEKSRCTIGLYTREEYAGRDYERVLRALLEGGGVVLEGSDPWVIGPDGEKVAGPFYRYGKS